MKLCSITVMTLSIFGSTMSSSTMFAEDRAIYGADNRLDLFEVTNADYLKWAKATAIISLNRDLTSIDDDTILLKTKPYKNSINRDYPLCPEERFYDQLVGGDCSGFWVGKDIFVTAAHCINDISDCRSKSIIFDFSIEESEGNSPQNILKSNIYRCTEIVARKFSAVNDFAILRLDREVIGREPLDWRKSGKIEDGQELVLIGHPMGIPTKVASDAQVIKNDHAVFFTSNTDSLSVNSGSAVINGDNGEVEGILVRGAGSFEKAPGRNCMVVKRLSQEIGKEDIIRTSEFINFLPK